MATIPSELPFDTDASGMTYKLRQEGIKACQNIRSKESHDRIMQTLKVLAKYAGECYKDREGEVASELARREARSAEKAKYQHGLQSTGYALP